VKDPFDQVLSGIDSALDDAASKLQKLNETKKKFEDLFKKQGKPKPVPEPNLLPQPVGGSVVLAPPSAAGFPSWLGIAVAIAAALVLLILVLR
jgi:hypothetical protein